MASSGSSRGASDGERRCQDGTRYIHFTDEQIAVLDKVYAQCPHPSASQRLEMKRMFPVLNDMEDKQIRAWFQNHRSCEKLKKEHSDLHSVKEKLDAANKLLKDENDNLMKQVTGLLSENDYLQQQLLDVKHF